MLFALPFDTSGFGDGRASGSLRTEDEDAAAFGITWISVSSFTPLMDSHLNASSLFLNFLCRAPGKPFTCCSQSSLGRWPVRIWYYLRVALNAQWYAKGFTLLVIQRTSLCKSPGGSPSLQRISRLQTLSACLDEIFGLGCERMDCIADLMLVVDERARQGSVGKRSLPDCKLRKAASQLLTWEPPSALSGHPQPRFLG